MPTSNQANIAYANFGKMLLARDGKKQNTAAIIFIILGLTFITYDLINFNKCGFTLGSSETRINGKLISKVSKCQNLHLGLGAGIAFLYFGYFIFIQNNKHNKRTVEQRNNNVKKYYSQSSEENFTFSEDGVVHSGGYFKSEMKWDIFSKYSETNGYLLIYDDDIADALIYIRREVISEADYTELISLLNSKLKRCEI
jgi:hypothetical protein